MTRTISNFNRFPSKGTRIIYERNFLLQMRNSPSATTPPAMPTIPGVTKVAKDTEPIIGKQSTASPLHKNHSPILAKPKESDLSKKIPGNFD